MIGLVLGTASGCTIIALLMVENDIGKMIKEKE